MSVARKERPIHKTYTINDTLSLVIYARGYEEATFVGDKTYIPVHPRASPPIQAFPSKVDVACFMRLCKVNDNRITVLDEDGLSLSRSWRNGISQFGEKLI